MDSSSSSLFTCTPPSRVPASCSARIRIGVSLLQRDQQRSSASLSPAPPSLRPARIDMPIHAVYLGGPPYMTTSPTLAADYRAWGYRVDVYAPHHHNALALLAMQRAEGFSQTNRESELMDIWCAEWVGRWGFEARVGAMLSEREGGRAGTGRRGVWDFGAAVGTGRNSFTEDRRAAKAGRGRRWGLAGVRAWFGGGRGDVAAVGEAVHRDEDALPPYTKGEDPPAYEQ